MRVFFLEEVNSHCTLLECPAGRKEERCSNAGLSEKCYAWTFSQCFTSIVPAAWCTPTLGPKGYAWNSPQSLTSIPSKGGFANMLAQRFDRRGFECRHRCSFRPDISGVAELVPHSWKVINPWSLTLARYNASTGRCSIRATL